MKEWLVKLAGKKSDLEDLPLLFTTNDITVTEENDAFYLKSLELNTIDNVNDVVPRIKTLLRIITTAASFHFQSFTSLDIADLIMIDDKGVRQNHMYLHPATGLSMKWLGTTKDDGTFIPANKSRNVEYLVRLSLKYKEVSESLQFFKEDSWISLYKILEIIRDELGGERKLIKTKWTTLRILKRFTQTAQSKEILGEEARHASNKYKPPKDPMSKYEAHYFIRELLLNWIETKQP